MYMYILMCMIGVYPIPVGRGGGNFPPVNNDLKEQKLCDFSFITMTKQL